MDKARVARRDNVLKAMEGGMSLIDAIRKELAPLNNPANEARYGYLSRQIRRDVKAVLSRKARARKKEEATASLKESPAFKRVLADARRHEFYHKVRNPKG